MKAVAKAANELADSYQDASNAIKDVSREVNMIRKLWKQENKPHCVSLGLTLIALPDPFIVTDVAGTALLAFGLIQYKIKNSGLYLEDVYKTFPKLFKELDEIRLNLI
jgi:hypothetical protein